MTCRHLSWSRLLLAGVLLALRPAPAGAEGISHVVVTYADGQKIETRTARDSDQLLQHFVFGLRDGRLEAKHGQNEMILVRKGKLARVILPGEKPKSSTISRLQRSFYGNKLRNKDKTDLYLQLCRVNLEDVGQVLTLYKKRTRRLPSSLEVLVPRYLIEVPRCPTCNDAAASKAEPSAEGGEYVYRRLPKEQFNVSCSGDHVRAGIKGGFPTYSSRAHSVIEK